MLGKYSVSGTEDQGLPGGLMETTGVRCYPSVPLPLLSSVESTLTPKKKLTVVVTEEVIQRTPFLQLRADALAQI